MALFCLSGTVPRNVAIWCVDCHHVVMRGNWQDSTETKIACPHHLAFVLRLEGLLRRKETDADCDSVCAGCRLKRRLRRRKAQRLRRLQPKEKR
jgi:hypothetical protein